MPQPDTCPRCGGLLQAVEDKDGPYLRCFSGCVQIDLLQPPPEILDLLIKVENHSRKQVDNRGQGRNEDTGQYRPRRQRTANNISGVHQTEGRKSRGGKRHEWLGAIRQTPSWSVAKHLPTE